MSYKLNARLLGLVLAVVLGLGGAALLPGHASADIGVDLDLTSSEEGEGILEIDLEPFLELGSSSDAEADADVDIDVDVTDDAAEIDADVDAEADAENATEATVDLDDLAGTGDLLGGIGGIGDLDTTVDSVVETAEPVVDPLIDACANVHPLDVTVEVGDTCGGGDGILDPVIDLVEPTVDPIIDLCLSAGVDAEAGTDCDGSGDDDTGDILEPVTELLDGDGDLDLGDIDSTVDSVVETAEPIVDPLIDACANVEPLDVTVEVGETCGGGDGVLDPVLDLVEPTLDPIVDVCLSAGVDAEAGTDCDGSGDEPGNDGIGSVLEPVTDLLDGDGDTGDLLEPVTELLGGDGDLELGDLDSTVDGVAETVEPVIDPLLDACVGVAPLDVTVEIGETCGGGEGILDPVLDLVEPTLDPIIDVCLSAGVDAEAGTDCDGSGDQPGGILPELPGLGGLELPDLGLPDANLDEVGETVEDVINPLDVCLSSDPLNLDQELGAGCAQEPAECTLLNINCILPEILGPVIGPNGLVEPLLDLCLGYDPLGVNVDIGTNCLAASLPTCPPDCGPTCPPDCPAPTCPPDCPEPTCPPFCEPTCPPFCEPTCPPFCEPTCPPFCEPTCPPDCEPTCPPFCEPTCPPFCEPTCPPFCEPTCPPFCEPTCPPDCEPTCPPDCEPTCPPDCEPTCPPFCEPTCPPFCEPTCPPFCEPTCPPFCEPTCPPFCEPTCPPFCGPGDPGDNNDGDVSGDVDGGVSLDGEANVGIGFGGRGTVVPTIIIGDPTVDALPQAAPLESAAGAFVPPTAGSGGLLGMREAQDGAPTAPAAVLLAVLAAFGILGCCRRRTN